LVIFTVIIIVISTLKGIDLEHGYVVSEWSYESNFSNAKKEQFTMQCPYARINYVVQFQVGAERASRTLYHVTFY
jgi:hypothetical protein